MTGSLMTIAHFVLFTPFSVAWTKLTIRRNVKRSEASAVLLLRERNGAPGEAHRDDHRAPGSRRNPCAPPPSLRQRNFDNHISLFGELQLGLGIYAIAYVRLAFLFPVIAIGRYAGLEMRGSKRRETLSGSWQLSCSRRCPTGLSGRRCNGTWESSARRTSVS